MNCSQVITRQAVDVCPPDTPDCTMNRGINSDRPILAGLSNGVRADTTMASLMAVAAHVSGIPGRKNLVWLTSNLAISPEAAARAVSGSGLAVYPVDARGLLPIAISNSEIDSRLPGMIGMAPQRGTPAARSSSLSSGASSDPNALDTLQILAEETGGRAFINTNDLSGAVREVLDDGTMTYSRLLCRCGRPRR